MNENVSSGADQGLEGRTAQSKETATPLRTAATALLSAADIWSTDDVVTPAAETIAVPRAGARSRSPKLSRSTSGGRTGRRGAALAQIAALGTSGRSAILQLVRQAHATSARPHRRRPPLLLEAIDVELARRSNGAPQRPSPRQDKPGRSRSTVERKRAQLAAANLSLALQGGGRSARSPGACWSGCWKNRHVRRISGASVGAVNAALLACGLVQGGREGARNRWLHSGGG